MKRRDVSTLVSVLVCIGLAVLVTIVVFNDFGTPRQRAEKARQDRAYESSKARFKPVINPIAEEEPYRDPGIEKAQNHLKNSPFKNKTTRPADGDQK